MSEIELLNEERTKGEVGHEDTAGQTAVPTIADPRRARDSAEREEDCLVVTISVGDEGCRRWSLSKARHQTPIK